ncbi:MAG TPA: hypothetical protein VN345_05715 [Blastocatellia bacterium]|jgi:hypothetical protein|nr:hypothetical protein [Blastocatellia bacterium]
MNSRALHLNNHYVCSLELRRILALAACQQDPAGYEAVRKVNVSMVAPITITLRT